MTLENLPLYKDTATVDLEENYNALSKEYDEIYNNRNLTHEVGIPSWYAKREEDYKKLLHLNYVMKHIVNILNSRKAAKDIAQAYFDKGFTTKGELKISFSDIDKLTL